MKDAWCHCGEKMEQIELNGYYVRWCPLCDKVK